MSGDTSIRRISIAEQADAAAWRTVHLGGIETNPHPQGTDDAAAWQAAYERFLLLHSSGEASA